jgi:hypothetical protein
MLGNLLGEPVRLQVDAWFKSRRTRNRRRFGLYRADDGEIEAEKPLS